MAGQAQAEDDDDEREGNHVVYLWTFTGHDAQTGNPLNISGWEEWELDDNVMVKSALGWFDADDYQRQVDGAIS